MGHGKSWHIETLMRQLWGTQGSIRAASFSCGNMRAKKGEDLGEEHPGTSGSYLKEAYLKAGPPQSPFR